MTHTIEELLALPDRELDVLAARFAGYDVYEIRSTEEWIPTRYNIRGSNYEGPLHEYSVDLRDSGMLLDALAEGINGWEFETLTADQAGFTLLIWNRKGPRVLHRAGVFFLMGTFSAAFPRLITAAFIFAHEQKEEKS